MITDRTDTSWWPDLARARVAIIAAGPSLTREQCDTVRGLGYEAVAINESWRLTPGAFAHYICDWQYARWKMPRPEALHPKTLRIIGTWPPNGATPEMGWMEKLQLHRLHIEPGKNRLMWNDHCIGAGGNSAFQMLNWVLRCGCRDIIFLGLDCHTPNMHWHGSHDHPEKPIQKDHTLERWKVAFHNAAQDPKLRGVRIYNCSPSTALNAFPCMPLDMLAKEAA